MDVISQCQIVAIVSTIIITHVCLFIFLFLLLIACMCYVLIYRFFDE